MPPRPICFMVMPFATKETQLPPGQGPARVDFDRLWFLALDPLLVELGYHPLRADQDVGASIIREMLERLALSDLVVADLSIPNANVYYEVGVRHAARATGCVLIAADWARLPSTPPRCAGSRTHCRTGPCPRRRWRRSRPRCASASSTCATRRPRATNW